MSAFGGKADIKISPRYSRTSPPMRNPRWQTALGALVALDNNHYRYALGISYAQVSIEISGRGALMVISSRTKVPFDGSPLPSARWSVFLSFSLFLLCLFA